MLDYTTFTTKYPEFAAISQAEVEGFLIDAAIETNGYLGLPEPRRQLAVELYAAHFLKLREAEKIGRSGIVKKVKTYEDEIEFAVNDEIGTFDFGTTVYGRRLENILNCYSGGFLV